MRHATAGHPARGHIVDSGFLDAELLIKSQAHYGVSLLGPTRPQRSLARTPVDRL
jgi:hypothetical protein